MATYTLDQLVDGIATVLSAAASLKRSQTYDEITEGIHDLPTLQVYPEENMGTSYASATDALTLDGTHSIKEYLIHADLLARQRSHIGEDMGQLVTTINELEDILEAHHVTRFSLDFVVSFRWSWRRVTFDYGGVLYVGARFALVVECGSNN